MLGDGCLDVWVFFIFVEIEKIIVMSFKFEKLKIWQKSMDFGEDVYSLIQTFPKLEKFNP
jgi:hypothetical protein